MNAAIDQPDRTLTADKITMLFEADNTVQHALAEGQRTHRSPRPDHRGHLGSARRPQHGAAEHRQQAIVSGGAKFNTHGDNLSHGSADTFILDFEAENQPTYLHMVKNARMRQDPQPGKPGSPRPADGDCRRPAGFRHLEKATSLRTADTVGKAQITILPALRGRKC